MLSLFSERWCTRLVTNMKKKLICFLLVFALGLVPALAQAGVLTASAAKEPVATVTDWKETHKKIAENSKFNLYVCEDDLSLVVEDKATDFIRRTEKVEVKKEEQMLFFFTFQTPYQVLILLWF